MVDRYIEVLRENEASLKEEQISDAKLRKVRFTIPILEVLKTIECRPLRMEEMRLLRAVMMDYINAHGLQIDKDLIFMMSRRFSMAYLPAISFLGVDEYIISLDRDGFGPVLEQYLPSWKDFLDTNKHQVKPSPKASKAAAANQPHQQREAHLLLQRTLQSPSKPVIKYYLCSFRRNQSTLWTSYRLYLDGVREMSGQGEYVNTVQLEQPIMLLGAKKLKSGISAQCFVWKTEDAKQWKEKSAIGKLTRNANTYMGIPFLNQTTSEAATKPSEVVVVDAPESVSSPEGESDVALSSVPSTTSDRDPVEITTTGSKGSFDGSADDSSLMSRTINRDLLEGGPVGIAVQTKGQEKLIQLTIAIVKPPARALIASGSQESLLSELEQLVKNPIGFTATVPSTVENSASAATAAPAGSPPYLVLRSKLPRKLSESGEPSATSSNGAGERAAPAVLNGGAATASSSQFGVTFGKASRIRYASRKNLAADIWIDFQSNQKRVAVKTDWSTDQCESLPLLQVRLHVVLCFCYDCFDDSCILRMLMGE